MLRELISRTTDIRLIHQRLFFVHWVTPHWAEQGACRLPRVATKRSHVRHKGARNSRRYGAFVVWAPKRTHEGRERNMTLSRSSLLALTVSTALIGGATLAAADGPSRG